MDLKTAIGFDPKGRTPVLQDPFLIEYVNLKLASNGLPVVEGQAFRFMELTMPLIEDYQYKSRLLRDHLNPPDRRIQDFLEDYLKDTGESVPVVPSQTMVLDRHGVGRVLSLPADGDYFESDIVKSYRVCQGVLHNPKHDKRTTKGSFHIAEGGFPIPNDKIAVPKLTYLRILERALQPPKDLMRLPFTSNQENKAHSWVSLLLRPRVCPEVPGWIKEKTMEIRFFAPGNLVSNLDFVESIFGNAGDPALPENDAALDTDHWSGHSGCVILAPHLIYATKKELGLPHINDATERQKADGMCWESEGELYNGGSAFKLTARNSKGVMVTIIADNYFGYCKKEVKTQIGFAANLHGLVEEEHAGGALAFPSYDLGDEFFVGKTLGDLMGADHSFSDLLDLYGSRMDLKQEGYAIDRNYSDIYYVPEDAHFSLFTQKISWKKDGNEQSIRIKPGISYFLPSGYKVEMFHPKDGRRWRLIGRGAEGTYCHKPCTVSGGGKSEISKPISDSFITGPVFVADYEKDLDAVDEIIRKEYGQRFRDEDARKEHSRALLDPERSLGSVVKLLSPHESFSDEYNEWVKSLPLHIRQLVFSVKRIYKAEMGDNWREHFHVDIIDGKYGNELKFQDNRLVSLYTRIGFAQNNSWRTFELRKDYHPAEKLQMEDDITASVVVPTDKLEGLNPRYTNPSQKFAENCEYRLFQRPDDAIHRGYDKATEDDFSHPANFFSNYQPLTHDEVGEDIDDNINFNKYTQPMRELLLGFQAQGKHSYAVSTAHPRLVDGKPTKNPRYLQDRGDLVDQRSFYVADVGTRLYRRLPADAPVPRPVDAVLPGRRNNPPEEGVRALCVYNPIHYMELPELFMEYIASMTGKSPSTTGAGSEGALTKGPFNALCPITDINNALVDHLITGHHAFLTSTGYVGPHAKMDHDISYTIPEVWCRMRVEERDPKFLIENGYLEKCEDFEHEGRAVPASVLGYRITEDFMVSFYGRILGDPSAVFTEEMLRPEKQDMGIFIDALDNIIETHKRVAQHYFEDGSIEGACPPLKALLHIMARGEYEGKKLSDPEIRKMFTREYLLESDWYAERLHAYQLSQIDLWQRHIAYLKNALDNTFTEEEAARLNLKDRLARAEARLSEIRKKSFLDGLTGTIGLDPWVAGE